MPVTVAFSSPPEFVLGAHLGSLAEIAAETASKIVTVRVSGRTICH